MIVNLESKLSGELPVTKDDLIELISSWGRNAEVNIDNHNYIYKNPKKECYPLENLDVSQIEDMSYIFIENDYNGDLSKWDVSNCKIMDSMFWSSEFNNDSISNWNVSNVTNMDYMFFNSEFNNDSLKDWDVSNVEIMSKMFSRTKFNGNISNWDISKVISMNDMFYLSYFDGDLSKWNFNKDVEALDLFYDNESFKNKYNQGNEIPNNTKEFLEWFEENRNKIRDKNTSKEEVLDFFSFEEKKIKNDLI